MVKQDDDSHAQQRAEIESGLSQPGSGYDDSTGTAQAVLLLDKSVCKLDSTTRRLSIINIILTAAIFVATVLPIAQKMALNPQYGIMKLLNFFGIVLSAIGSAILIFMRWVSPYSAPPRPAHPWMWRTGWGLLFAGFVLQGIAAFPYW